MNKYTVILLRPDYIADTFGYDVYIDHVVANDADADGAVLSAQLDVFSADGDIADDHLDYHPLAVFRGHHDAEEIRV